MLDKIKVNRKTYEELVVLESLYGKDEKSKNKMMIDFVDGLLTKYGDNLYSTTFYDFSKMIVLGYELEETKEEKLLKFYNEKNDAIKDIYSFRKGILTVLDIYNLKVDGINK